MTNILKTPAEYAKQLNECYSKADGIIAICIDLGRAHTNLPFSYIEEIANELHELGRSHYSK